MAGVGITENKIYPKGTFGHRELFTHEDITSPSYDQGGAGLSRFKSSDEIARQRFRTQERLTLDDVRWSDMRKKVPGMGRVPQSKIMEIEEEKVFQKVSGNAKAFFYVGLTWISGNFLYFTFYLKIKVKVEHHIPFFHFLIFFSFLWKFEKKRCTYIHVLYH